MELHPENARPYDVQLGRLGAQYTQRTFNMQNLPSEGIASKDISGAYLAYRDDCGGLSKHNIIFVESFIIFGTITVSSSTAMHATATRNG